MPRFFTKILWNLALNIGALAAVVWLLRDVRFAEFVDSPGAKLRALVIAGIFIGILNMIVKPLLQLMSLPLIILTFGLFLLLINTFIFYLTIQLMRGGEIIVASGLAYLVGALVFSIVNTVEHVVLGPPRKHAHDSETRN